MISRDIIVGSEVKNINQGSYFFGRSGTIVDSNAFGFKVQYFDDGQFGPENYSWAGSSNAFEISLKYRPATIKDLVVGAKIRGSAHNWLGRKTGTLIAIIGTEVSGSTGVYYHIQWDDNSTGSTRWFYTPTAFIMNFDVSNESIKKRKPKRVIPDIPLDSTLPILQAGYLQDRMRKQFR
jgi:hypothetical protein